MKLIIIISIILSYFFQVLSLEENNEDSKFYEIVEKGKYNKISFTNNKTIILPNEYFDKTKILKIELTLSDPSKYKIEFNLTEKETSQEEEKEEEEKQEVEKEEEKEESKEETKIEEEEEKKEESKEETKEESKEETKEEEEIIEEKNETQIEEESNTTENYNEEEKEKNNEVENFNKEELNNKTEIENMTFLLEKNINEFNGLRKLSVEYDTNIDKLENANQTNVDNTAIIIFDSIDKNKNISLTIKAKDGNNNIESFCIIKFLITDTINNEFYLSNKTVKYEKEKNKLIVFFEGIKINDNNKKNNNNFNVFYKIYVYEKSEVDKKYEIISPLFLNNSLANYQVSYKGNEEGKKFNASININENEKELYLLVYADANSNNNQQYLFYDSIIIGNLEKNIFGFEKREIFFFTIIGTFILTVIIVFIIIFCIIQKNKDKNPDFDEDSLGEIKKLNEDEC